jgi:hypothetical protein
VGKRGEQTLRESLDGESAMIGNQTKMDDVGLAVISGVV